MSHQHTNSKISFLKLFIVILLLLFAGNNHAQKSFSPFKVNINKGWQFSKASGSLSTSIWQPVNMPHTWNIADVMDDEPGYYRGVGLYKKVFTINNEWKGKEISIYFEGANQETEVFINGKKAGHHIGGYTGFSVSITKFLNSAGSNELLVKVDNSFNKNVAPLTADFTFYGGIYRDVYLVAKSNVHFSTTDAGSNGVYVTTPNVSKEKATINIKSLLSNKKAGQANVAIITTVFDNMSRQVAKTKSQVVIKSNSERSFIQTIPSFNHPKLWSPENPYLYSIETKIIDAKGEVLDIITNPLGFRWFSFDAAKGFFLNGALYKLVGASRHQDYKNLGNAVPDSLAIQDVVLLKNMGANFLRVAHYPQDPSVMNTCDRLGLLASVEIPIVNEITETDSFYRNCEVMQTEMIRQNFNHPSVVMWCYMNEVLLRPQFSNDKERQKIYLANITSLAQRLEDLTRKEDPYRYTMMANHGNLEQYKKAGLLQIPMIVGWNLYSGWYGGSIDDFPQFLDDFHKAYPGTPFMVTEYGADADPRIRSMQPVRFDKSIEYTTRFHQFYLTEMLKRPYVAGAIVWNLADFNSETRTETMPHINNKGLLEWDRTPKDPYYFYKAMLVKKPFIKILGSCMSKNGIADTGTLVCYQAVQIASNLDSVTIELNGKKNVVLKVIDGLCEGKLPFKEGWNRVTVKGRQGQNEYTDNAATEIRLQPNCLQDEKFAFSGINIMLGSTRFFTGKNGDWWQPDQVYKKGGWGSIGGKRFKLESNNRLPYGTDKNILGTDDDPVYQTQQTGIKQYRLDVPRGKYEVTLHFAELAGGKVRVPPYNLGDNERTEQTSRRIFNVRINGSPMLQQFNITEEQGVAKAVAKSTTIIVNQMEGILIDFEPVEGEPILNALQLKKIGEEVDK